MNATTAWQQIDANDAHPPGLPSPRAQLSPNPVATYRMLFGYYTDRPAITDAPGQPMHSEVQHVAAWVVIARHVPSVLTPPAGTSVVIAPPVPSVLTPAAGYAPAFAALCEFVDTLFALDATTGRVLGSGTL